MSDQIGLEKAPSLDLPRGSEVCQLSIINTTCDFTVPRELLVEPEIKGHEWLNLPTYSFHIKHEKTGKQILFDLGCRTDWDYHCPPVADVIKNHVPGMKVQRDVVDILHDGGVDINNIETVVLSHWHFDHCGDPAALPKNINLFVGPDFKEAFLPGWPSNPKSPFHEAAFDERRVIEVPFSNNFKIGRFQAYDYFGDSSFFVLNVPGHALGHIAALVRTTEDTFVFLGGDVCHFGGSYRPTKYIPIPSQIPEDTPLDERIPRPCPCSAFTACHPVQRDSRTTPFYRVSTGQASWYADPPLAQQSIDGLQEFDADLNVLIAIAHDPTSLDVFTFFPNGTMNSWQKKGWKQALHWGFLNELPFHGRTGRPKLVDGLYINGRKIKGI